MSRGMRKTTFREIKSSFGRYMAILLIIALGVGFFAGLKVAYRVMLHSTDLFFHEHRLYDFHYISTMGFDEDVEKRLFADDASVTVESSKSVDVLMEDWEGAELVVKTIELPRQINQLDVVEGRMAENVNECLVDAHFFKSDALGKKLCLSEANDEDALDSFAEREYTIVGIVRSALYTHYTRGNASVGNGSLDAYIYVTSEAYDMDYDTDIYLCMDLESPIYSAEYEDAIATVEDGFTEIVEAEADARYDRIYDEAMEEINDARQELDTERRKGEKELADAHDEIEENRKKIEDGEAAIATARRKLGSEESLLLEKESEYKSGLEEYNANKADYDENVAAFNTAKAEYEQKEAAFAQMEETLPEEIREQTRQELAGAKQVLDATEQQLAVFGGQLAAAKQTLDSAAEEFAGGRAQIASAKSKLNSKSKEIEDAKEELADGEEEYADGKREFDEKIADAEQEIADAVAELDDLEKPEVFVLKRDSNFGYASFENDADIISGVSRVFPIFFFLVAALVCMTTMTRMMEEQRTQIGILKALGYSNGSIIGKYIVYSGSASILGAVLGFAGGTWIFSFVIWISYRMMYDLGDMRYIFLPVYVVVSVIVAVICSAGTTFFCCHKELQEMAAALMRPKAPRVGKRVLLERIPFVWNRLKFLDKVSVRNLFRYKKRMFMMILGVSGCTALLIAALGIRDSIAKIADKQFEIISMYDATIGSEAESLDVDGIDRYIKFYSKSVDLKLANGTVSIALLVPEDMQKLADYLNLYDDENTAAGLPERGEVYLPIKVASDYGSRIGDEITVQNGERKGGCVKLGGVYRNYFQHYAILDKETCESLFGAVDYNCAFAMFEEGADSEQIVGDLMKTDDVTYVSLSGDIQKKIADMMVSLDYVVIVVVIFAALLAFVVIYNLNNINITERIREIATIKVLGFYQKETNSYVFRENVVLTLLGSLVGLVLGYYLHRFVMGQIQIENIAFDVHVSRASYLLSVVLTLAFNQIVNLFMSGKLEGIDMAESLKSVE